jgi:hypothetical protein
MAKSDKQAIAASKARNKAKQVRRAAVETFVAPVEAKLKRPARPLARDTPVAKAMKLRDELDTSLRLHGGDPHQDGFNVLDQQQFNEAFGVVLAKTKLSDGVDKKKDWGYARGELYEIIGEIGWCNLVHTMASCLRLWAEVPGIVAVDEDTKKRCHDMAAAIQAVSHQFRLIDDAAVKPSRRAG